MPEKLIIGCGYLGKRVARTWQDQGFRVAALTRSPQHAQEFRSLGIEPILGDITQPQTLTQFPPADTVLYAVGYDRTAGPTREQIYVDGLQNVLQIIASRVRRFLYISSTSVYGQSAGEWVDEESATQPARHNGQVCLGAEQTVWQYFPPQQATPQTGANVLRLSGIYGPSRLLSRIESLKNRQPLKGHPDSYLNLIHVTDAVQAVLACEKRGIPGQAYLVSDDRPLRRREYYEALARQVDAPAPVFEESAASNEPPTTLNKRCANRKLREELQVELAFPTIETGLADAVKSKP